MRIPVHKLTRARVRTFIARSDWNPCKWDPMAESETDLDEEVEIREREVSESLGAQPVIM